MTKLKETLITECFIKGVVFTDLDLSNLRIKRGDRLGLVHEPNNEHDCDAIAVMVGKSRLGYVPAELTQLIHDVIDQHGEDTPFRCVVKQVAPTNATHRMFYVQIYAKLPQEAGAVKAPVYELASY